jgi:hypothetical protein
VFAQEIPGADWIAEWRADGFTVVAEEEQPYAVRSAVIARAGLSVKRLRLSSADYHGSYVAAASLTVDGPPITLVSMHASPSRLTSEYVASGQSVIAAARQRNGEWWDADFVLGTLADLVAAGHQVVAAGDLNECLTWDLTHDGLWGRQFFDNVERAGLTSATLPAWEGNERPTYLGSEAGHQLDHVLVTPGQSGWLRDFELHYWNLDDVRSGDSPDHAWIEFLIDPSG